MVIVMMMMMIISMMISMKENCEYDDIMSMHQKEQITSF